MRFTTCTHCSPPDNHAVDFPATFDIDFQNRVIGNAAAGSTRLGFQYAGEQCLEDNQSPTGEEVGLLTASVYKVVCVQKLYACTVIALHSLNEVFSNSHIVSLK